MPPSMANAQAAANAYNPYMHGAPYGFPLPYGDPPPGPPLQQYCGYNTPPAMPTFTPSPNAPVPNMQNPSLMRQLFAAGIAGQQRVGFPPRPKEAWGPSSLGGADVGTLGPLSREPTAATTTAAGE